MFMIRGTQALRIANVFARDTVKGNCKGSNKRGRHEVEIESTDEPLPIQNINDQLNLEPRASTS